MKKTKKRNSLVSLVFSGVVLVGGLLFAKRKDSTAKLARFHGWRGTKDFIHSYAYLRWTSTYLKPVKYVLEHPRLFSMSMYKGAGEKLMQTHHAKVITNETAKRLVDIKEPVVVRNPEQVLPFERARDIILENSENIAVTDCPCRQIAENPCLPIDVCFVLGEPFVDFVVEHKKGNARRVSTDEALHILEREHERGRVHTAWFKDAAGDRLYSLCNCCSCCCLGMRALSFGFGVVTSSGYTARIDHDSCTLCGTCADSCHFHALSMDDQVEVNDDACKGCGVCVEACPVQAITLEEDANKPGPIVLPR